MLDVDKQRVMPLYPLEIYKYLLEKQNNPDKIIKKDINYILLDCRIKKKRLVPQTIEIPKGILKNSEASKIKKKYNKNE